MKKENKKEITKVETPAKRWTFLFLAEGESPFGVPCPVHKIPRAAANVHRPKK